MKKYVALLRGINVGGNNKIAMPELKQLFESLGYTNVSTYINSGNVIFETKKSEKDLLPEIEAGILKQFDLSIRVIVRDQASIEKVCNSIPSDWKNDAEQKTDVMFLWPEYEAESSLDKLSPKTAVDSVRYVDGAIIWHLKKADYSKSGMEKLIGSKIYKNMTIRNVNTVRKLVGLMGE